MIKRDLQRWYNHLSLSDRLQVQKFVIVLYYVGEDIVKALTTPAGRYGKGKTER